MEEVVALIARAAGTLIEGMAVLIVAFGSAAPSAQLMRVIATPSVTHGER